MTVDGGGNTLAAANAKIAAMQAAVDTCQAQNKRLTTDLTSCQAASGGSDSLKRGAAPQDTRLWNCTSKDGKTTHQGGQWEPEAQLDTKAQVFVIWLTVRGVRKVVCPAIGDLRDVMADEPMFCKQIGDQPFFCKPLP
jgi:hypothetical protein